MLIWYAAGAVAAIFVAWLAALIHASGHAPIGLVSLGVGVALGSILAAIAATQRVAGVRRLILGTLLLAILTVLSEHAWLYLDFRRQWQEARIKSPQVALFRSEPPLSPAEYFAHESTPQQAVLWGFDATIITSSAVAAMLVLRRNPK